MIGRVAALSVLLALLAAAPATAQEAGDSGRADETCAVLSADGIFELEISCPPGTRDLLKQLPRLTEPAPRHDIVIDPEWPHDQAMIAEHDWPHDWAMVVPQTNEKEKAIPLFDDLLQRSDPLLSNDSQDGSWGDMQLQNKIDETAE